MARVQTPRRGEIWLIDFDPAVGAELRKVRPAVVVSLDTIGRLPLRMVAPITDWKPHYANFPWFVQLSPTAANGLVKESRADAFQTKSVSDLRFVRRLGAVSSRGLDAVASAIALCVGAP